MPTDHPTSRLTQLCAAMGETLAEHPDYEGESAIMFVQSNYEGGLQILGYESHERALIGLIEHLRAELYQQGKQLTVSMTVEPLALEAGRTMIDQAT